MEVEVALLQWLVEEEEEVGHLMVVQVVAEDQPWVVLEEVLPLGVGEVLPLEVEGVPL